MTIVLGVPTPLGGYYSADTTSLREIEQEVARRVGPFQLRVVTNFQPGDPAGPASTTTSIAIKTLRSSIDLGGLEDMYVLRRGRLADGTRLPLTLPPVPPATEDTVLPYDAGDRVRLVRNYDPINGVIEVDDAYLYPTNDGEEVELHHLDPAQELRPMVLAGLRRCWLTDIHAVPNGSVPYGGVIDLTQTAPWLTTRDQVYDVTMPGGTPMVNWRVNGYGGGLSLRIGEWSPQAVFVLNRRPAATKVLPGVADPVPPADPWVVRSGNPGEPWDDEDRFAVPLDYAAAAGHIEGWRTARPRLTLVAQTGMWAGQPEAAAEFTRVATVYFDPPRHQNGLPMWPQWAWDSNLSNV